MCIGRYETTADSYHKRTILEKEARALEKRVHARFKRLERAEMKKRGRVPGDELTHERAFQRRWLKRDAHHTLVNAGALPVAWAHTDVCPRALATCAYSLSSRCLALEHCVMWYAGAWTVAGDATGPFGETRPDEAFARARPHVLLAPSVAAEVEHEDDAWGAQADAAKQPQQHGEKNQIAAPESTAQVSTTSTTTGRRRTAARRAAMRGSVCSPLAERAYMRAVDAEARRKTISSAPRVLAAEDGNEGEAADAVIAANGRLGDRRGGLGGGGGKR